jgi:hypothetical protein
MNGLGMKVTVTGELLTSGFLHQRALTNIDKKFSPYIRNFRVEHLQSHTCTYMREGFLIYEEKRKYFPIYEGGR